MAHKHPPKFIWHLQFWGFFLATRLKQLVQKTRLPPSPTQSEQDLVDYYCKLHTRFTPSPHAKTLSDLRLTKHTGYAYDIFRILANFPKHLTFDHLWGDVIHIPNTPTFVKSRPIAGDNANSVLLPLDSYRHFRFVEDGIPYDEKLPMAVWRGAAYQAHRVAFLEAASKLAFCDVANTHQPALQAHEKTWMSIEEQLHYKVIFSIEGNDVATNLKWIMSSNSLCFSPKLVYETWYREGQLIPNVHYVEIRSDFSDIEEKFNHYMNHPEEAKAIIRHAQAYAKSFMNQEEQRRLAAQVAHQYLIQSNQAIEG